MHGLHLVCQTGDRAALRALLAARREEVLAWRDREGWTALMKAAMFGRVECVRLLIDAGADVNVQNKDGSTTLIQATALGRTACVRLLIGSGARFNMRDQNSRTALIWAATRGQLESMRLLIDAGTDIEAQGKNGQTALARAALKGHVECVRLLVNARADLKAQDKDGKTAADYAKTDDIRQLLLVNPKPLSVTDIVYLLECLEEKQQEEMQDLVCPVCHELRFDLHQCDGEGHSVCGECCGQLKECPHRCGGKLFTSDKRGQRQLRSVSSVCPWRCGWSGVLKDAETHTKQCGRRKVKCSACGEQMQSVAWAEHEKEQCPKRRAVCEHCGKKVAATSLERHVANRHALCPVPECGFRGRAARLEKHMAEAGVEHTGQLARRLVGCEELLRRTREELRGEIDDMRNKHASDMRDVREVLLRLLPQDADLPQSLLAVPRDGRKRRRESRCSSDANKKGRSSSG